LIAERSCSTTSDCYIIVAAGVGAQVKSLTNTRLQLLTGLQLYNLQYPRNHYHP
jgi:hypothetical protein